MMWWWGDGHVGVAGWIGMVFMIIVWILIVAGIVYLLRSLVHGPGRHPGYWGDQYPGQGGPWPQGPAASSGNSEALRVLEERYAKGEIGRDEFLQKKADLTGVPFDGGNQAP